jgi:hypothetical protein
MVDRYHRAIDLGILDDQSVELFRGEIIAMFPKEMSLEGF